MNNTINFRGRVLTFNIETGENKNFISEDVNGKIKKFVSIGHETNNNSEVLSTKYLQLLELNGEVVEGSSLIKRPIRVLGSYQKFLGLSGKFENIKKAELNAISEFEIDANCIAFNPLKDFEPIQPITCDYVTSETGVTVNVIDKPDGAVLMYCIGNPESGSWLPLPTDEIPLIVGDYSFYIMNQSDGYPFGGENEFTIKVVENVD